MTSRRIFGWLGVILFGWIFLGTGDFFALVGAATCCGIAEYK